MESIALVVVGLALGLISSFLKHRKHREEREPTSWRTVVRPAIKRKKNYVDFGDGYDYEVVPGAVAIRLVGPGPDLTVGVVKISDKEFEKSLQELISTAEERAGALNSVADYR